MREYRSTAAETPAWISLTFRPARVAYVMRAWYLIVFFSTSAALIAQYKGAVGGVEITVSETASDIPGYTRFVVQGRNTNNAPRSLHGTIRMAAGGGEACLVYLEMEANAVNSVPVQCRGQGAWNFTPVKVYNFIPND